MLRANGFESLFMALTGNVLMHPETSASFISQGANCRLTVDFGGLAEKTWWYRRGHSAQTRSAAGKCLCTGGGTAAGVLTCRQTTVVLAVL